MQFIKDYAQSLVGCVQKQPRLAAMATAGAAFGLVALAGLNGCFTKKWDVKGKVVVITGASSGIGKSLALRLVRMGALYVALHQQLLLSFCPLFLCYRQCNLHIFCLFRVSLAARRESELNAVVQECNALVTGSAIGTIADVSVRAQNKALMDATVAHFGKLDVLVLNAGVSSGAPFEEVTESGLDGFESLTKTNYFGCVYGAHYALPELIKSQGKIVVISSVFGFHAGPTRSFYCGSKFALHGFFESLRLELAPKNVTVSMICPGPVATEIAKSRVGPDGKAATTGHFDMNQAISPDLAAKYITDAFQKSRRVINFSFGTAALYRLGTIAPAFWDILFVRGMRRLGMLDDSKTSN